MEHVEHKEMRELSEFEKAVERLCSEKCTGLDPEYDHRFFCMWTCHKGLCARSWYKSLCSSLLRSEAHSEEEFMNRIAEIVLKKAN